MFDPLVLIRALPDDRQAALVHDARAAMTFAFDNVFRSWPAVRTVRWVQLPCDSGTGWIELRDLVITFSGGATCRDGDPAGDASVLQMLDPALLAVLADVLLGYQDLLLVAFGAEAMVSATSDGVRSVGLAA